MAMTNEEIYQQATLKELGSNPTGTRMDVIYRAMDAARADATDSMQAELERVKTAAAKLCLLHTVEQEGLSTVSSNKWVDAVNNLSDCIGEDFWKRYHQKNI